MARKKGKGSKRGSVRSTSVLTSLFAIVPVAYVLTATPSGQASVLANLLGTGGQAMGSWQSIAGAGYTLATVVTQNWVTILIILAIVYVAVKVTRRLGAGVRITKHLRM